jgi:hypothetical protein
MTSLDLHNHFANQNNFFDIVCHPCGQPMQVKIIKLFLDVYMLTKPKQKCVMTRPLEMRRTPHLPQLA